MSSSSRNVDHGERDTSVEPDAGRYLGVKDTFDQALADFAAALPTGPRRTQSS
jgi:hypothetical protein